MIRIDKIRSFTVFLAIFGFWYNLPVISTNAFSGFNEFRIYDFTGLIFYILALTTDKYRIKEIFIEIPNLKRLYRFVIWCTIMTPVALLIFLFNSNFVRIGATIIYLHHLWSFFLTGVFLAIMYKEQGIKNIVPFFLFLNLLVLLIFYVQRMGLLESFWNVRYIEGYGKEMTLSATLGPNRIVFGMMTSMGFIFALFVIISKVNKSLITRILVWLILIFTLPALIITGSRTSFLFFVIFLAIYAFLYNRRFLVLLILLGPVIPKFYSTVLSEKHLDQIETQTQYNRRKLLKGDNLSDLSLYEGYSRLGSNRDKIAKKSVIYILKNPVIWPFGSGFNNEVDAGKYIGAAMPHNIYLALIIEVGFVGLFLYLKWYFGCIKFHYKLNNSYLRRSSNILVSLIIAMLISLLTGEHMYIYRAHFAMFGTFIFIMTITELLLQDMARNSSDDISIQFA